MVASSATTARGQLTRDRRPTGKSPASIIQIAGRGIPAAYRRPVASHCGGHAPLPRPRRGWRVERRSAARRFPILAEGGSVSWPVMTAKEQLRERVEMLSEAEAAETLALLDHRDDPVVRAFRDAALDDEPWTEADEAAMAEVRADRAAGVPTLSLDELRELADE